eukprot:m.992431 g.992431  ORF g.992431 m.992431 type:complete len:212 (+) comp24006_c0_seq11:347-982(+)
MRTCGLRGVRVIGVLFLLLNNLLTGCEAIDDEDTALDASMDFDDMIAAYGARAEQQCMAVGQYAAVPRLWGPESCRTLGSVVEEFFKMKETQIKQALTDAGHSKKRPVLHFENFEDGIGKAIAVTSAQITQSCDHTWSEFNVVIKRIADIFQPHWMNWLCNEVFAGDTKLKDALGDGKWDFKLQDENGDYGAKSGMLNTGRSRVNVGSTRL